MFFFNEKNQNEVLLKFLWVVLIVENPIEITSVHSEERRSLDMYYQPRTVLLTLASDFILNSTDHYLQLQQDTKQSIKSVIVEDQAMVSIILHTYSHTYIVIYTETYYVHKK